MPGLLKITAKPRGAIKRYQREFTGAIGVIEDLAPSFDQVFHPFMLAHMRDVFRSGGAAAGAKWRGYDGEPRYGAFKARVLGQARPQPLRWQPGKQERLYPSLTEEGGDHVHTTGRSAARFGTAIPYAARLERGGVGPYGETSPPRVMLRIDAARTAEMAELLKEDILARIGGTRRPRVRRR